MYVANWATITPRLHGFLLPAMRRTKEDAQQTREALLDAAELLFSQRGVARTSLQDIAKAAGVTRGALYWHFEDKAELFNAMMARTTLPMEDALKAIDTDHAPQPLLELKKSMLSALHRIAHDPRTHRVFDIATHKVEYVDDLLGVRTRHLDVHKSCGEHIEATFRHAIALGQLPATLDAHVVAVTYQALVNGLINTWMLDETLFELCPMAERSIDLFLSGLQSGAPATMAAA
jgi:TetR/AcrR family acrAB operon transcriptional repressor